MKRPEARLLRAVERLADAEPEQRLRVVRRLTEPQKRELDESWPAWRHEGQAAPADSVRELASDAGDGSGRPRSWRTWLLMAGRGFGKTRAGAEWVSEIARRQGDLRIALVGATVDDVHKVMIEGQSGLRAVAATGEPVEWTVSAGRLTFASGAQAFVYSGENPEKLRGPEHHFAWCDEIAKWRYPDAAWNNLQLGLRLGRHPRVLVTTTPRPAALLKRLVGTAAVTRGRTADNLNIHPSFLEEMIRLYGGTTIGRQELDGELVEDWEGAMWTRALIEECRTEAAVDGDFLKRVVVGVDPPASTGGTCGIVACGVGRDGLAYVLGDHSVSGLSPDGWARVVGFAAELYSADRVVAESNQGGDMVESVLRSADVALPVKPVHARFGKGKRAEPVAVLFARGKARFAGAFPELEDELCGLTLGEDYGGRTSSPDRADAMVWALTELMLGKPPPEPRVRRL